MWTLLRRQGQTSSLYWLLRGSVLFGGLLDCLGWGGPSLSRMLHTARVSVLGQVMELTGPQVDNPARLAAPLGVRCVSVAQTLETEAD